MTATFELFDHTADLGVRVRAATLFDLVVPATAGFYATIGTLVTTGNPTPRDFDLSGDDPALLLRDYLAELLRLFDHRHEQFTVTTVAEFSPARLLVQGQSHFVDAVASDLVREVKAVTYHELAVRQTPGGWEAVFIVDI
jgi:SHS2 domain-containing protein